MANLPPDQLFLDHLDHIEWVATHFARKAGFSKEEIEDFVSHVKLRLIEDDYAIIRKFQGKSSFKTYLTVVIRRLFLDYLDHKWGKWRPSAEAERQGDLAVRLEKLLHRDGCSLDEAYEILRTNDHLEITRQELADLAAKLPRRNPRPPKEGEEVLDTLVYQGLDPEKQALNEERAARLQEVLGILKEVLAGYPDEDVLLVKMRATHKVSDIARILRLEQKPLYRRLEKIFKSLREDLEARGVRPEEIKEILGSAGGGDEGE